MAIFFFLLNAVTAFGNWWFHWPIMGWGIGVLFHYLDVFGLPGVGQMSNSWEQKAMEDEPEAPPEEKAAEPSEEVKLLREIRDSLKK